MNEEEEERAITWLERDAARTYLWLTAICLHPSAFVTCPERPSSSREALFSMSPRDAIAAGLDHIPDIVMGGFTGPKEVPASKRRPCLKIVLPPTAELDVEQVEEYLAQRRSRPEWVHPGWPDCEGLEENRRNAIILQEMESYSRISTLAVALLMGLSPLQLVPHLPPMIGPPSVS